MTFSQYMRTPRFLADILFLCLALFFLSTRTASAQTSVRGVSTYDYETGVRWREGAYCELRIEGDTVHDGFCRIGRRGSVTIISTGKLKYRIERAEEDDHNATFHGPNGRILDNFLVARGSCWRGESVRFCSR